MKYIRPNLNLEPSSKINNSVDFTNIPIKGNSYIVPYLFFLYRKLPFHYCMLYENKIQRKKEIFFLY